MLGPVLEALWRSLPLETGAPFYSILYSNILFNPLMCFVTCKEKHTDNYQNVFLAGGELEWDAWRGWRS